MNEYKYHTIEKGTSTGRIKIIATQKYVEMDDGPHYLGHFDYVIMEDGHLISTGNCMGSSQDKMSAAQIQEILDKFLSDREKFG